MEKDTGVEKSERKLKVTNQLCKVEDVLSDEDKKVDEYGKEVRRAFRVIKEQLIELQELCDSKEPGSQEQSQIERIIVQLKQEEERLGRYLNFYVKHRVDSVIQEFRSGLEKSKPVLKVIK